MFRNLFFIIFLIFSTLLSAAAQFDDVSAIFEVQPPLTQKDIDIFVTKYSALLYINDRSEELTPEETSAYIKRSTGLTTERFLYIFFKIPSVYTIMQDENMEAIMEMMPEYVQANSAERALITKNSDSIAQILHEIEYR